MILFLSLLIGIILLLVNVISAARACRIAATKLTEQLELLERRGGLSQTPEETPPHAPPKPMRVPEPVPKHAFEAAPVLRPIPAAPSSSISQPENSTVPPAAAAACASAPGPEDPPSSKRKIRPKPIPSEFEQRAAEACRKIWNWIVVGEEFRPRRVAVEYAVATVWLVRCAVVLLLIGIGFFVKYSHDNNLVSPQLRIAGVILLGITIVGAGCRLVKSIRYRLLGTGLSGIGVVTLYFAIFAAASIYKFLPASGAFALMVLITIAGALLALRQNSLFVALVAVIGGYFTPILLSSGAKQLPELFCYLLLIGAGSLFLSFYRNWRLLNFVAFILHYAIFAGAVHRYFDPHLAADYWQLAGFGCVFFVLFSLLPLFYSLLHQLKVTLLEILLLAANGTIFLSILIPATQETFPASRYAAGVTLFAALVFSLEFLACTRLRVRDRNLYPALLAFSSAAVALTFPLLLSGHWITAAWAVQAAATLYLGTHTGSGFLTNIALFLYWIAGLRAVVQLETVCRYTENYYTGLLDRGVSLGSLSLALLAGFFILKRGTRTSRPEAACADEPAMFDARRTVAIEETFLWAAAIFLFILFRIEIAKCPLFPEEVLTILPSAILYFAMLGFMFQCGRRFGHGAALRPWMAAAAIAAMVDLIRLAFATGIHSTYQLDCAFRLAGFLIYCAGLAVIAKALSIHDAQKSEEFRRNSYAGFFAIMAGVLYFCYSSAELYRGLSLYLPEFASGALSVLWALYALILLISGIRFRLKAMRFCGLGLFALAALKALLLDLSNLPALYRVLAFLAMGLLFFIGAFAYMRVEQLFRPPSEREEKQQEKDQS